MSKFKLSVYKNVKVLNWLGMVPVVLYHMIMKKIFQTAHVFGQ